MKIVILDAYTSNPGDLSWAGIEALGDCHIYDRTAEEQVVERCHDAEAVLTNKVVISDQTMARLPKLRYIGVMATGYNIVDVKAAAQRGIIVTNVPAYSTASVAQIVFAHLLNVANKVQAHSDAVRRGEWTNCKDFTFQVAPTTELAGMQMGIVGLGQIGSAVARIALAMGMKVAAFTSKSQESLAEGIQKMDIAQLFASSDVLTLHCPLTESTREIVNKERLATMKPTAIVINTGRGPLVNEQDLACALNSGRIAAACVDVLSQEPPRADNPLLAARNCFFTPHIAWASQAARTRLIAVLESNLRAYQQGKPQNQVN